MNRPIITLTTDFGARDSSAGVMKGVILRINPDAVLVDLTHEIGPGDVEEAAGFLAGAVDYFPGGTIHLAVVDPGVGTARRPVLMEMGETRFVGPDNGIFSFVGVEGSRGEYIYRELKNPRYRLEKISSTFHGRDIFAPAAAWLSLGVSPAELGPVVSDPVRRSPSLPVLEGKNLRGRIERVDRFGNAITNIRAEDFSLVGGEIDIEVKGRKIRGCYENYEAAGEGAPGFLINSDGMLEIFLYRGSAAAGLGIKRGDEVIVRPQSD